MASDAPKGLSKLESQTAACRSSVGTAEDPEPAKSISLNKGSSVRTGSNARGKHREEPAVPRETISHHADQDGNR